jgi:hypothetical protein
MNANMIAGNHPIKINFFKNISMHAHTWCFVFFMLVFNSCLCFSQQVERKIIIEEGTCYYTTIDPEFQIATLHAVELNKPLKKAKKLILPAGRNFNVPVNPFCWDIAGKDVLAINFMNNARSNRKQAVKRIPIRSLNEWDERTSISDVVISSAEYPSYAIFEPYKYILERSSILDHFFFDGIASSDSSFCFAISNNGALSTWQYSANEWSRGGEVLMQVDDFFSLVTHKMQTYLIVNDGNIYALKNNQLMAQPEKKIQALLSNVILIIDKMKDTVSLIPVSSFDENKSMEELMKEASLIF